MLFVTYFVVFLFSLSSSCVPSVASFSGLSILIAHSVFSDVYIVLRRCFYVFYFIFMCFVCLFFFNVCFAFVYVLLFFAFVLVVTFSSH